ncbi:MAG: hypothetical protein ACREMB_06265 [Candidatus Rokuibacteriota bacterium]
MRVVTILLTAGALLSSALGAAAQTGQRPVTGGTAATAGSTNTNTVSSGSNSNTNANSNSQFLSGNNTGVNNGSLEVYAGSEPYQGIVFGGSTNLPQLPGIPSAPSNFSQPYRPDAFVNTPPFLPAEMTLDEAKRCRDAKASWYGGSRDDEAPSIKLFYAGKPETPPVALTMANYVGTAMATTADGPFLAALCEAAHRAMRKGATVGMVEFNIRPRNTMMGLGFGAAGGATGLPAAGAHPYAIAGTLGFGTGWSNQRVEGEVVLQLTALHGAPVASTEPGSSSSPAAGAVTPPPADDTPTPGPVSSSEPDPSAAPRVLLTASAQPATQPIRRVPELLSARRPEPPSASGGDSESTVAAPATAAPPASASGTEATPASGLAYHSVKGLARLRAGQSKDEVFGIFGSLFATRDDKITEIQGMRLRTSGQSVRGARIEVSEVSLADETARETPYWFLFADGRLLTWGRSEQWGAAAARYGVDLPYRPPLQPLRLEVKADLASGR